MKDTRKREGRKTMQKHFIGSDIFNIEVLKKNLHIE